MRKMEFRGFGWLFVGCLILIETSQAATFTVVNTNDLGAGSLRQAILGANAQNGFDVIEFSIAQGAGVRTIRPQTPLPQITEGVRIDGLSQPGASCAQWPPTLLIELDGSQAADSQEVQANGLTFSPAATGSNVTGLVINRFPRRGILMQAGDGAFLCNFIGTDAAGIEDLGNGSAGIHLNGNSADGNTIGGLLISQRNLISGNHVANIFLQNSANENLILGNYIGTDATGMEKLQSTSEQSQGIQISNGATGNRIGGAESGARNIISGNSSSGIYIGSDSQAVYGNWIGLTADGTAALGNRFDGISVVDSANHLIGNGMAGGGNVISGNASNGIDFDEESASSYVLGNFIGTDPTGTTAIGNFASGIRVEAPFITVGNQSSDNAINVISGNIDNGIHLTGELVATFVAKNNRIGTNRLGTQPIPNLEAGILIEEGAHDTTLGGDTLAERNAIAYNGGAGIRLLETAGDLHEIRGNYLFSNTGLGIDLGAEGVNPNDEQDADTGPNGLQNFPVLTSVVPGGGQVTISGSIAGPSTQYILRFYQSSSCDASSHGEGEVHIGTTTVGPNEEGVAEFELELPVSVTPGSLISATASTPLGNSSEFSPCITTQGQGGTIQFGAGSFTVYEEEGSIQVQLMRTGSTVGTASISYTVTAGTATTEDFVPTNGTVQFQNGVASQTFEVVVKEDDEVEGEETMSLNIGNATGGATLGAPDSVTLFVRDGAPPVPVPASWAWNWIVIGMGCVVSRLGKKGVRFF